MILFIKEKLLENWFLKLTAIVLALILWLFIQGDPGRLTPVEASVEIQGLPGDMEITSELPRSVQVTIRGARQELKCVIDLQDTKEGENIIPLRDYIKSTRGLAVEVSRVDPSQITLMLEKTVSKEVAVSVPVEGDPADGFDIYEKILNPDRVTITGPQSRVTQIEEISTEVVDINDRRQSANFLVRLNLGDGNIRSSLSNPVEVEIRIGPNRQDYTVKDVPLSYAYKSYDVTPKKIDIRLLAPVSLKEALVPRNFNTTIAPRDLEGANFPIHVKPIIAFQEESWIGFVKIIGTTPPEVEVDKIETETPKQ